MSSARKGRYGKIGSDRHWHEIGDLGKINDTSDFDVICVFPQSQEVGVERKLKL